MVEHRKAHFRELFARVGQPINESEFECMSAVDIAEYASDQRSVLLGHNRHIAFCSKCAGRYLDTMTAILKETNGMVMSQHCTAILQKHRGLKNDNQHATSIEKFIPTIASLYE